MLGQTVESVGKVTNFDFITQVNIITWRTEYRGGPGTLSLRGGASNKAMIRVR